MDVLGNKSEREYARVPMVVIEAVTIGHVMGVSKKQQ